MRNGKQPGENARNCSEIVETSETFQISAEALQMMDSSVENLKKGIVSDPVDLDPLEPLDSKKMGCYTFFRLFKRNFTHFSDFFESILHIFLKFSKSSVQVKKS